MLLHSESSHSTIVSSRLSKFGFSFSPDLYNIGKGTESYGHMSDSFLLKNIVVKGKGKAIAVRGREAHRVVKRRGPHIF
jgi:hypothetical protein